MNGQDIIQISWPFIGIIIVSVCESTADQHRQYTEDVFPSAEQDAMCCSP